VREGVGSMVDQGIALAALLVTGSLAIGSLGWAEARAAIEPSRDTRSAAYCSRLANVAGFYDTEAALACRREEYTAAARARSLAVPREIDEYCESLAGEGETAGPFSWRAYVDCVDSLAP
jgi:hypothetical protein